MYALKQPPIPFKSSIAGSRRSTGKFFKVRTAPTFGSRSNRHGSVRAVISGGDKAAVEASTPPLQSKDLNASLVPSSPIEVQAVVTIRKKMKEKVSEKIEDQWEFFINGIGQGILIQLISEEIDPGNCY